MNACFLMYTWNSSIKSPENDTSLVLIDEATKKTHGVTVCTPANLTIRNSVTNAFYTIIKRIEKVKSFHKRASTRKEMLPLVGFDVIFMRAEPSLAPVNIKLFRLGKRPIVLCGN